MSEHPWKAHERLAAALIGGRRLPAKTGRRAVRRSKHVKRLQLAELERAAVDVALKGAQRGRPGVVIVKRQAGRGRPTPVLVVMTGAAFLLLTDMIADPMAEPGPRS